MTVVIVPGYWDLPTLNEFIAQQENFLRGTLRDIKSEGDGEITILDFDDEKGDKPTTHTLVTTGSPPPGAKVVSSARINVASRPALAIAYRSEQP
jgi:hypothetical protein